jgi:hypothetical protein
MRHVPDQALHAAGGDASGRALVLPTWMTSTRYPHDHRSNSEGEGGFSDNRISCVAEVTASAHRPRASWAAQARAATFKRGFDINADAMASTCTIGRSGSIRSHNSPDTIRGATATGTPSILTTDADAVRLDHVLRRLTRETFVRFLCVAKTITLSSHWTTRSPGRLRSRTEMGTRSLTSSATSSRPRSPSARWATRRCSSRSTTSNC